MLHETLSLALSAGLASLTASRAVFDEEEASRPFQFDGIPYPQPGADGLPYKSSNFPLSEYKGKATKKYGHVTIWRHESGRYEVNSYVL